jgi:hypothetical protein
VKYEQTLTRQQIDALSNEEFEAYLQEHLKRNKAYFDFVDSQAREGERQALIEFKEVLKKWIFEARKSGAPIVVTDRQAADLKAAGLWSTRFITEKEAKKIIWKRISEEKRRKIAEAAQDKEPEHVGEIIVRVFKEIGKRAESKSA